jgi:hypothetical protein
LKAVLKIGIGKCNIYDKKVSAHKGRKTGILQEAYSAPDRYQGQAGHDAGRTGPCLRHLEGHDLADRIRPCEDELAPFQRDHVRLHSQQAFERVSFRKRDLSDKLLCFYQNPEDGKAVINVNVDDDKVKLYKELAAFKG